jgi:hypothetical protein
MLYHIGVLLHPILFHRICVWTGQCLSRTDVFFLTWLGVYLRVMPP